MSTQTHDERAQRRAHERERISAACEALLTSEGWRKWVRTRSTFRSYSLNNQFLIALQAPEATRVCGFHAWRSLGRQVRRGETSIRIIAPISTRKRDAAGTRSEDDSERTTFFRMVPVFDIAQTDPIPGIAQAPLEPPAAPISGDSHAHLIPRLVSFAETLGFSVSFHDTGSANGFCDRAGKRIAVDETLPANGCVRVLVHELCHALGAGYDTYPREACEVIVDCAAMIVCSSVGLDTSGETVPYITGWAERSDAAREITRFARVIDEHAAQLETALDPPRTDASMRL